MSKQTSTSRRHFLKGAAYASVLSVGGLSSLAIASSADTKQLVSNGTIASTITLFNQSAKTVVLDAKQPISLEKTNGWVVVKVNKASNANPGQLLNIEAGQELSFTVNTESAPIKRTVFVGDDNFPASLFHKTMA